MIRRNRISGERVIERVYQVHDFTIFCIDTAQDVIRKGIGRIHFIREEREMNDARLQGQMYKRFDSHKHVFMRMRIGGGYVKQLVRL